MSFEGRIRWMSASMKPVHLAHLKCRFKNVINSKRKYSQVNDFFDLVGILIIRGIISTEDVTVIDEICQDYFRVRFSTIPETLNYTPAVYRLENAQSFFTPTSQPNIPPAVIDIIVNGSISEKQWRPFARALKVDTDNATQETSTPNRIHKVLKKFVQDTDRHRQWPLLEVALEKIHRMDLRDQCCKLLNSHSYNI